MPSNPDGLLMRAPAAAAPYLLALFPLCFMAQKNIDAVDPVVVALLALVILALIAAIMQMLRLVFATVQARRLWLAGALACLLFYPMFRAALSQADPPVPPLTIALLFALLAVLLLFLLGRALRRRPAPSPRGAALLGLIAAALIAGQAGAAGQTIMSWADYRDARRHYGQATADELRLSPPAAQAPDICLVLLDEYARTDQLRRLFNLDNETFHAALRHRGFGVNTEAFTNYSQTLLVLASMFNLDYLPPLPDRYEHWVVTELTRNSRLLALLRAHGYLVRDCSGGYAGVSLEPPSLAVNLFRHHHDFLQALLQLTPLPAIADHLLVPRTLAGYGLRSASRAAFARAALPPDPTQPTFTFLHSIITHQPLVFMADGAWPPDGPEFTAATFPGRYGNALQYSNTQVLQLVDRIQAGAVRPQVILLQADHGTGTGLDWESLGHTDIPERFSVFSAVYYSPGAARRGPPAKTPVNLFRGVLNDWLGGDYAMLPDRAYYSTWDNPYRLTDVTDSVASPFAGQAGATAPASVR